MAYKKTNIGMAAVALGAVLFVIVTGDIIFRVLGALLAFVVVNHGLQLMGKPPLFVLIQNWFDQAR